MIEIGTMSSRYLVAGPSERRGQLARRLDRVATERIGDALTSLAADFADPEGRVYFIRRLDLSLWLNVDRVDDAAIARQWAEALGRALSRQILDGGSSSIVSFPSRAAYLASWIGHLLDRTAGGRWEFDQFEMLDDVRIGHAISHVLASDRRWIIPTFQELAARRRASQVVQSLSAEDIERLWTALVGQGPRASSKLHGPVVERLRSFTIRLPIEGHTHSVDARARTALTLLIELTGRPNPMTTPVAADLALQLGHLATLFGTLPALRSRLRSIGHDTSELAEVLRDAPAESGHAAAWLTAVLEDKTNHALLGTLTDIVDPAPAGDQMTPDRSETRISAYAGVALLLAPIRAAELAPALGLSGLHELLIGAVVGPQQTLARSDPALRWLAGLPTSPVAGETRFADPQEIDSVITLARERFTAGLRGMPGSSPEYLSEQFFARSGTVTKTADEIRVRLAPLPLKILLSVGGRLGDQGEIEWLSNRRLVLEVHDG